MIQTLMFSLRKIIIMIIKDFCVTAEVHNSQFFLLNYKKYSLCILTVISAVS